MSLVANISDLNKLLAEYDAKFNQDLQVVLDEISLKSKALASNLKECLERLYNSERYLNAYQGKQIAMREADLSGEEFDKHVRPKDMIRP